MKQTFLLIFFLAAALWGRENPFMPTGNTEEVTKNVPERPGYFTGETLYLPSSARILKEIKLVYQNVDGSVAEEVKQVDKKVDWHHPVTIDHMEAPEDGEHELDKAGPVFKSYRFPEVGFLEVKLSEKLLKVECADTLMHHFLLTKPYRIVMDFQRETNYRQREVAFASSYFLKGVFGSHDGYYRLVLYLDSYYKYQVIKEGDGYLVGLQ